MRVRAWLVRGGRARPQRCQRGATIDAGFGVASLEDLSNFVQIPKKGYLSEREEGELLTDIDMGKIH